ncbi:MAG: TldD/PmbA family protein [Candidatus Brocadia sp.]|uniref:Peptidase n=1 Tax=Candidatus Brocadia fulgida TaxID=380242 RepID=A0A0M2V002_9BACT|nr:MAG: peptidase [Candidatus Brocadia fulgida]UJS21625.1 MAG: TldD/PmbA family protein [Candidatus Brocadia sp.]
MNRIEEKVLELALKQTPSAEVLYDEGESRSVSFENNKLKYVSTKSIRGIGLRVIKDGKIGFSSTTDFRKPEKLVANAIESAKFGQTAAFEFPSKGHFPKVAVFDQQVIDYPIHQCVDIGKDAIERALSVNANYECSVSMGKGHGARRLINSKGLDVSIASTSFGVGIEILEVKGQSLLWVGEGESSKGLVTNLNKHLEKALRDLKLAGKELKLKTGVYPVVVTAKAMGNLLATFESDCNGKLVQKGASPLTNRLGEKILDERVSIYDDATIDMAGSSYPWDAEGMPSQCTPLFEKGVLKNYIFDLQTAGIMKATSTGNGNRSFASQPSPGNSNITVEPGNMSFEAMVKDVKYGVLVDQVLGGGQSNILAGEFSVNIDLGYLIENGEIVGRVKDCMIAGNAFEVFNNIVAIGDTAEWHGSTKVPPFYLKAMNIAGNAE